MSVEQTFTTGSAPTLRVEHVAGDLIVQAWPQAQVALKAEEENDLSVEQAEDVMIIGCASDLLLRVPIDTAITISAVQGDGRIVGVRGLLHIERVEGDLQLRDGGNTRIDQIQGDLTVRQLSGELTVDNVEGDAAITDVTGHLLIAHVQDDLSLAGIGGSIEALADDDVSIHLNPQAGERYVIKAGGDISCRVPEDANVELSLEAGGEISVRKLAVEADEGERMLSFTLGDGSAHLALQAGGDIALAGRPPGWGAGPGLHGDIDIEIGQQASEMAEELGRKIEVKIEAATQQIDAKLAEFDGEEITIRVQDMVQAALNKAEGLIVQAVRGVESRGRSAERRAAPMPPQPPRPPRPGKPAAPPVSGEERMAVLRMVDEGKITVKQAEELLTALRGKSAK